MRNIILMEPKKCRSKGQSGTDQSLMDSKLMNEGINSRQPRVLFESWSNSPFVQHDPSVYKTHELDSGPLTGVKPRPRKTTTTW